MNDNFKDSTALGPQVESGGNPPLGKVDSLPTTPEQWVASNLELHQYSNRIKQYLLTGAQILEMSRKWTYVRIERFDYPLYLEILDWCASNINGLYCIDINGIYFCDPHDKLVYALRWQT